MSGPRHDGEDTAASILVELSGDSVLVQAGNADEPERVFRVFLSKAEAVLVGNALIDTAAQLGESGRRQ